MKTTLTKLTTKSPTAAPTSTVRCASAAAAIEARAARDKVAKIERELAAAKIDAKYKALQARTAYRKAREAT